MGSPYGIHNFGRMKLDYKTIPAIDSTLQEMGDDWWILSAISDGKFYFLRPRKTSRPLVAQNRTLELLETLRDREWLYVDLVNRWLDSGEIVAFAEYWLERWENSRKYRFEKEKAFDVKLRLKTWFKRKTKIWQPKVIFSD